MEFPLALWPLVRWNSACLGRKEDNHDKIQQIILATILTQPLSMFPVTCIIEHSQHVRKYWYLLFIALLFLRILHQYYSNPGRQVAVANERETERAPSFLMLNSLHGR
jgi:hypothetical protein